MVMRLHLPRRALASEKGYIVALKSEPVFSWGNLRLLVNSAEMAARENLSVKGKEVAGEGDRWKLVDETALKTLQEKTDISVFSDREIRIFLASVEDQM